MFGTYVVLLVISGVVLLALAAAARELPFGSRFANGVFGVGFLVYAGYLGLVFEGGKYHILWAVFVLPVSMLVQFVRSIDLTDEDLAVPRRREPPVPQTRRTAESRERRAARTAADRAAIRAKHTADEN
ncbi:hypothetical protein [Nocardia sp. NPDC050175]|uniref:hypothetical protein n=1 Tax=Nocardia sp. NPDC050175 TaxID=3364317 RepID=UPI00379415E6